KAPSETASPQLVSRIADTIMTRTWIRRAGLTYVVQRGFTSASPRKAAMVANTIMDEYLKQQLDNKLAAVIRANTELGQSLEKMRQDDEAAQTRLQEYKNAHGLMSAE